MTLKRIFVVLVFVALSMGGSLFAQSDRATITGTVTDSSSAVMPGARVVVTNVGTGIQEVATTDNAGRYTVGNLPVGGYAVSFSKDGFKTLERNDITLLIGQVAELDASLQVGNVTQTVEVTSETPILHTQDSVQSTNLTNQEVSELPLNVSGARTLATFMFAYVPGVEGSDYTSHIDGSMAFTKEVLIDGTSAVSQLGGYISESEPPMEAVQEFEVDTSGISSDAGRSGGGVFKYEMKSGTNQIHGSLFGFMHSTALDAESAENKLEAIQDPANAAAYLRLSDSLSDWGGSFGGAIVKNKLFYYGAFERFMQSDWLIGALSRTVPTDAMMGLNPDGSVAAYADMSPLLTLSNPLGTDACGNTFYQGQVFNPQTNCAFVDNHIPTSMISKTSAQVLQLFHQYYKPESSNTLNDAGPADTEPWFHNTQTSIKIDYYLSAKQHINGSYYYNAIPRILADQGGAWSSTAIYGGPMANSYHHDTKAPGARLSDSYTLSPNLVNTVYATFNRFYSPSIAISQTGKWDSKLGFFNGAGNFPLMVFDSGWYTNGGNYQNGWTMSNLGSQYNDWYGANTFIYSDELVWNHGRHNFKFGAELRAMQINEHPDTGTFNKLNFDPTSTNGGYGGLYNLVGDSFSSFLLGQVYQATEEPEDPEYGRRKAFGAYASDDIKVNPRLTMNLSLRWDFNNPYKEEYGHWSNFNLTAMNPVTGELGEYQYLSNGSQSFETRQDWYNFSPHVGAAFKLTDKTVVRGNIGVFFTPLNMNTWGGIPYQQTGNPGFYEASVENNFDWDAGYHPVLSELKTPDYTQWGVVHIDPRSLTPGNVQQYNVGVQREVARDTIVDANWTQSHSYHLQSGTLLTNQPTVANMQNYVLNGTFPSTYNGYFGYGGTGPGWQGITPYPQIAVAYGPMFSVGSPLGNADYKSMQFTVTRRAAKGLELLASYNWSRSHGDVDSAFEELWWAGSLQNVYDLQDERKDISDFDMTHIVKGYVIYNLPFGHGQAILSSSSRVVNALIGGWSVLGDFHYNTGTPISVHSQNSYPGFNSVYIDLVPGCQLTNGSARSIDGTWLNKNCFQNPANAQLGTGGNFQSQVRNPGLATEDLGVHKAVTMGPEGRYRLELRMEFFNVFNRDQLGGPDTNLSDGTFGQILGYGGLGGRQGQFGARFTF
jgi:Carboxypeptidase regulatory-like domain